MSDLITKIIIWMILAAVLISVVTGFRADIMSGGAAYDMLVATLDAFPFAAWSVQIVATIGQFGTTLQGLSPTNIIVDLTKLFTMSVVCPMIIGFCTWMLLPVPSSSDWYERERYMNRLSYRVKEALLGMLAMPICAWLTVQIIRWVQNWVVARFPVLNPFLVNLAIMVLALSASTLMAWLRGGVPLSRIVRHRLITDLLGNLVKIIGTNLLCFAIVLTILNDQWQTVLYLLVVLFVYLLGISLMVQGVKSSFD